MKLALMIIDMQKAFYQGSSKESMDSAVEYINAVIPFFRKKELPIIWVQDKDTEDNVVPGEIGFDIIESLKPEENDYRIIKEYGNSFNKTNCIEIINKIGIDTILLTGYCAEYCVLSTYRGASDLDLTPILLRNGIASGSNESIQFVENISNIVTYHVLKKIME